MAVELLQMQSHPEDWSHDAPSQEPMQSFHEHEGSQPWATVTPARAAMAKDFISMVCAIKVKMISGNLDGLYGCRED